jgi:hypothetical protein
MAGISGPVRSGTVDVTGSSSSDWDISESDAELKRKNGYGLA